MPVHSHRSRARANMHATLAGGLAVGAVAVVWLAYVLPRPTAADLAGAATAFGVLYAIAVLFLVWVVHAAGAEDEAED